MTFLNLKKQFTSVAAFSSWLATYPKPAWVPIGSTYHNTFHPNESEWRGVASMESMQEFYESKTPPWDRGPHLYLAVGSRNPADDGIWVMTPPTEEGIHAGDCNDHRFGIEMVGDFQSRPMSEKQLTLLVDATAALHRWAAAGPNINDHRDCMPGRTCPGDAGHKQKPVIQQRLAVALAPKPIPPRASRMHGLVLTHADTLDRVESSIEAGGYDTLKIVTAWGLPTSWEPESRARALAMTCNTIVRTHAGDPSSGKSFPHPEEVLNEIGPWYNLKRLRFWIEIGNEPNSDLAIDPWDYRYYLEQAAIACKQHFPRAKLIAPAMLLDKPNDPATWLDICADVFRERFDAIGVHCYAYYAYDDKGDLALVQSLYSPRFPGIPLILSEYGINDPATPDATKGQRYAALVQSLPPQYAGATYYHLSTAAQPGSNDERYYIGLEGDLAYGAAWGLL